MTDVSKYPPLPELPSLSVPGVPEGLPSEAEVAEAVKEMGMPEDFAKKHRSKATIGEYAGKHKHLFASLGTLQAQAVKSDYNYQQAEELSQHSDPVIALAGLKLKLEIQKEVRQNLVSQGKLADLIGEAKAGQKPRVAGPPVNLQVNISGTGQKPGQPEVVVTSGETA